MPDKTIEEIVAEAIKPQLEKQFLLGMQAGYNACLGIVYGNINKLHTIKEAKKYLKDEIAKTEDRALINLTKENSD